jgi:ubiquinone/menaquinone biosynthesis C-methylase UbiE
VVGFDRLARIYDLFPIPTHPDRVGEALAGVEGPAVDLGGGTARFTERIHADREPRLVTDPSAGMLTRARQAGRPVAPVQADGAQLPLDDGSVGAISVTEAFHHFDPNQRAIVAEAARVLRPDGVLAIEEIDPSRLLGKAIELGENHVLGFGSVFLEPEALAALVREAFEDVHVEGTGSFTYLVEAREPNPPS